MRPTVFALLLSAPLHAAAQVTVIKNVTVVDVIRGELVGRRDITISNGRIYGVDRSVSVSHAQVIDGTGKYVIPGLFDMHAHMTLSGRPTRIEMPLFIANGVTAVRVMNADCRVPRPGVMGCLEQYREWQKQIEEGALLGPRLLALASWTVNGPRGITDSMPPYFKAITRDDGQQLARYFKQRGVDLVKIYQDIPREGFLGFAEEARKLNLPFGGHDPTALSLIEISNAGMTSVEHARLFLNECFPGSAAWRKGQPVWPTQLRRMQVDQHDTQKCNEVFQVMAGNKTWYVPTHLTRKMDAFADDSVYRHDERMKYIPSLQRLRWNADATSMVRSDSSRAGRQSFMDYYRKGLQLTGAAFRAGVPIMLGTDAGDSFVFPGFAVHDELEQLVMAGLTPAEALKTATYNPAVYLGHTNDFGSIEKGRRADLILLDANPLENVAHTRRIHAVIFGGKYLDRAALDTLLAEVESEAKR